MNLLKNFVSPTRDKFPKYCYEVFLFSFFKHFFLLTILQVKTQLQARATEVIAVGYQHKHYGLIQGLTTTYRNFGICGLWRGVSGALPRVTIGSAIQLSTFSTSKAFIVNTKVQELLSSDFAFTFSLQWFFLSFACITI